VLAGVEKTTAMGYLRMLALSRIYLDNFANVQASWVTQGRRSPSCPSSSAPMISAAR